MGRDVITQPENTAGREKDKGRVPKNSMREGLSKEREPRRGLRRSGAER
jgi:hypothetical protein